ncbi:MAG: arabinose isomerase [Opitutaceae bacterium]|jgi:L-arabinose isomerase
MTNEPPLRLGLCGLGLEAYWAQFAGLRDRLGGQVAEVAARLERPGVTVVSLGLVDTPERSAEAGRECRRQDIDVLFMYVTTYALSGTVLPLVQRAGVPVVVLNLQPGAAIDYAAFNRLRDRTAMTGEWLAYCTACPVPEIANVLARAGIAFHQVTGVLGEEPAWREIEEWLAAARVRSVLASTRLGLMGHYYGGMLDIMTDLTLVSIAFGTHVELLEVDELGALAAGAGAAAVARRSGEFREAFDVQPDCPTAELERAARTSVALDAFAARHRLGALAYYHKGTGNPANEDTMSSIILGTSLLTGRHIPVAGEYEVKNALAMKILDALGAGGSFTEYYAVDFNNDVVLMGHDGPGHIAISEGKAKVRPLQVYHGKVGRGLSIEMSVKRGPVTLLSVAEDPQTRFRLQVAEGESVAGEVLEIGNTNSRYRFPLGARGFVEAWNAGGPAHHCAVGVGHLASTLRKAAELMGLGFRKVC